jgi:hypothetical protein
MDPVWVLAMREVRFAGKDRISERAVGLAFLDFATAAAAAMPPGAHLGPLVGFATGRSWPAMLERMVAP